MHVGWAKIILLGEHAVVYGFPALAAALDRGVTASAIPTPAGGPLRLDIPAWEARVRAGDDDAHGRALAAIADAIGIGRPALTVVAEAQVPPGAGLGSSAALAVAIARALLVHAGKKLDPAAIADAATASEKIHHGSPSGIDVAVALAGGAGVFRRGSGLRRLQIAPLRVLVAPSGVPRSTSTMVERVAAATQASPDDARLRELGALTDTGASALLAGDLALLGEVMDRAHVVLSGLGVSTATLDALVTAARTAGAHGAKLTGAGGGGAVIAVAPPAREAAVLAAWKAMGVTGFVATVGR